ncbi:MAG: hypothetical protein GX576_10230 [Thauera phenolivorans]|uniref:Uncharacterized protein n=1 Tax=Thauera phenolivorans TaxID=1792543 RepID=A0A7X7R8L4_9RHOO|nr:hypothetical protein [Thauera phenolivorans]NLF54749.1 hypothetical protein [Thauera phenolivorans]
MVEGEFLIFKRPVVSSGRLSEAEGLADDFGTPSRWAILELERGIAPRPETVVIGEVLALLPKPWKGTELARPQRLHRRRARRANDGVL